MQINHLKILPIFIVKFHYSLKACYLHHGKKIQCQSYKNHLILFFKMYSLQLYIQVVVWEHLSVLTVLTGGCYSMQRQRRNIHHMLLFQLVFSSVLRNGGFVLEQQVAKFRSSSALSAPSVKSHSAVRLSPPPHDGALHT